MIKDKMFPDLGIGSVSSILTTGAHLTNTMIYITITSPGRNNTSVTRIIKTNSLDCTSAPSAEIINGRLINLYDCPENCNLKAWKRASKQERLDYLWSKMKRNRRMHIAVTLLAEALGAKSFKWHEI